MEDKKNTVLLKDVIYLDKNLWELIKNELVNNKTSDMTMLSSYPLYKKNNNGSVVLDSMVSLHIKDVMFFDVTSASKEIKDLLCQKYHVSINELPVPTESISQYLAFLPVDEFKSLNEEEKNILGDDFYYIEYRDGGLEVTECIMSPRGQNIPSNVYLKIDFSKVTLELAEKIMPAVTHLILNEEGYYDKMDLETQETKKYGI